MLVRPKRFNLFFALGDLALPPWQYLYPWVDLQPGAYQVKCLITGQCFPPQQCVKHDLHLALLQESERPFSSSPATLRNTGRPTGYHCTLVIAPGWHVSHSGVEGDLHLLFTAVPAFGALPQSPHAGLSVRGSEARLAGWFDFTRSRFASTRSRAVAARAVLYYLLRYVQDPCGSIEAPASLLLAKVLRWHEACPPSRHELHRNAAIFHLQGNRNPFIDFPSMARECVMPLLASAPAG